MAQTSLPTIRLLTSFLAVLLIGTTTNAQINTAYNIGSIGLTGAANPVFSGPVVITGANCFVLSNGVKTYDLPKAGYFSTACILLLQNESGVQLTAYPNPFINHITVQAINETQLAGENVVQIQLLNTLGRVIKTYNTDNKSINLGYQIPMSQLAGGVYYIKAISGMNNIQILPIVKIN